MQVARIPEVLILDRRCSATRVDSSSSFNARRFAEAAGLQREFVQDNHSRSQRRVAWPALPSATGSGYLVPGHGRQKSMTWRRSAPPQLAVNFGPLD
jgi:hypothetical protein